MFAAAKPHSALFESSRESAVTSIYFIIQWTFPLWTKKKKKRSLLQSREPLPIMPTPNLFVYLQTAFTPQRWFTQRHRSSSSLSTLTTTEHWNNPVPGTYTYKPGQGWYLTALDADPSKPARPERVVDVVALDRALLSSDYYNRCMRARMPGAPPTSPEVNFVKCDDGIAWVNDKDANGKPTQGPWQRFVIDKDTKELRPMCKGDDPGWQSRRNSPVHSSQNSIKDGVGGTKGGSHSKHNSKSSIDMSKVQKKLEEEATVHKGRPRSKAIGSEGGTPASTRPNSSLGSPKSNRSRPTSLLSPSSRPTSPTGHRRGDAESKSGQSSAGPSRPPSMRWNSSSRISSPLASPGLSHNEEQLQGGTNGNTKGGAKEAD